MAKPNYKYEKYKKESAKKKRKEAKQKSKLEKKNVLPAENTDQYQNE